MLKNQISRHDNILNNITFDELITTCQCNLKEITEQEIIKQFDNILKMNLKDAKYKLIENIKYIKKEI